MKQKVQKDLNKRKTLLLARVSVQAVNCDWKGNAGSWKHAQDAFHLSIWTHANNHPPVEVGSQA